MRPTRTKPLRTAYRCLLLCCLALPISAYFVVNEPSTSTKWKNGQASPVRWVKGLEDGIDTMDVEIARLSQDGLTFVARNVATKSGSLNIVLQDLPAGDDYFVILINSTHGVMYATSQRFTLLDTSSSETPPSADPNAPTVTVSGAPNPTRPFATTFAAENGAQAMAAVFGEGRGALGSLGLSAVTIGAALGALWTVW